MGYEKHSREDKETNNRRNGLYSNTLKSSYGEVEIDVLEIELNHLN